MNITTAQGPLASLQADLLVVFLTDALDAAALQELSDASGLDLKALGAEEGFAGKRLQQLVLRAPANIAARRVLLIGVGTAAQVAQNSLRVAAAQAGRKARALKAASVTLVPPAVADLDSQAALAQALEGFAYGLYSFDRYKTGDRDEDAPAPGSALSLYGEAAEVEAVAAAITPIIEGTKLARDLGNDPPMSMTPAELAHQAEQIASRHGLDVKIFDEDALTEGGFNLILGVGQGSANPPRLIHLTYRPEGEVRHRLALVGKGVTFDTGGYNLKPGGSMLGMHLDMMGAAAVLGAAEALGALKPEGVEIHFIVPTAENSISGSAMRPQDIIRGYGGKTVEIHNTDAEGRLILADALAYAQEHSPDTLIDLATLTGACVMALGDYTAGLFTDDEALYKNLTSAIDTSGESFWRMPLDPRLDATLDTPFADMKNLGARMGGAITAALFLKRWVTTERWAHLDIAGPAMAEADGEYFTKGGTGFGVPTLVALAQGL